MLKLNTFSIAARCARTGQLGVAVSTAVPGVGMLCPFVMSEVGAVATQSFVNPYLGIWGLEYLREGHNAERALALLKARDPGIAYRQLGLVDARGESAAYSGDQCDGWYGERTGQNYSIQGNMLTGPETLQAMEETFRQTDALPLAERLIAALAAGQAAGGDKRGRESAALKIYEREAYPLLDLRVDFHPDPVAELGQIYDVAKLKLIPLIRMLPTRDNPRGSFDMEESRKRGLLQDG